MNDWVLQVPNVLRHPFLLAVFTAFFVNGVTRTWQDRQKAFDVATGLVAAMSEASTKALLAVDHASRVLQPRRLEVGQPSSLQPPVTRGEERREYADALRVARHEWERDSAVLGTKLEAYYPSTRKGRPPIAEEWTELSDKMTSWMDEKVVGGGASWPTERECLFTAKARLIRLVLDERPAGFDYSWLPRRRRRT